LGLTLLAFLITTHSVYSDEPTKASAPPRPNTAANEPKTPGDRASAKKDSDAGAADKPVDEEKADAKAIYRKFQARTDIQADKTPLKEVVARLSKRHGIPIRLDEPAFKKAGIALDVPVTASIKNFTLNAALNHVLKDLKLHHVVKDGVILVTTGAEAVQAEEEVDVVKPVPLPAAKAVRVMGAPGAGMVLEAAPDPAAIAALEKQFTRQFRAALRRELNFVAAVCEPTEEQLEGIRDVLEKYRGDIVKKYSDVQKQKKGAGAQRRAPAGFPDPRKMVRDSVTRTVRTNLTAQQSARFDKEVESRNADRSRAAIHALVARLDQDLTLSAEQRDKLSHSLASNLNAIWLQQFEATLQQGNLIVPNSIPPKLVEPLLNGTQKTIWRRNQSNNNNPNQVNVNLWGGGIGGAVFIDLVDDAADEPENDGADDDAPPNEAERIENPQE
jgi:hypothetical protein